ncbi:MAG: hypothetical protein ABI905_07885 [Betaproteobacteria bacterium]
MSSGILLWWALLSAVAVANILAWSFTARALSHRRELLPAEIYSSRRLQLILAAGYVFGCAYRSFLPVYDVPRMCLFDSWFSSVIVGRSVATIAELCFVAQWALLMHEIARHGGSRFGTWCAQVIVPLIVIAETCSWYSVTTTSNLGHVFEETLWGISAALMAAGLVAIWPRCDPSRRPLVAAVCVVALGYVAYMFLVDVPMYWSRWLHDESIGRAYMSVRQGAADASARWVVSQHWEDWKNEVVWMSLYFSTAVWLSIAFVHTPPVKGFLFAGSATRSRAGLFPGAGSARRAQGAD